MNRLFAFGALAGFGLSLLVHCAALSGMDVQTRFPFVWLLHAGVFAVFIPFVLSSRKVFGPRPSFAQLRAAFPAWVLGLGIALVVYVAINFVLFIRASGGGNVSMQDGKLLLQNHGHTIREITSLEYSAFRANEVRGFSGHWLVFYYVPFAYFMFRKRQHPSQTP